MARRSERLRRRNQSSTPGLSPAAYSIHAGAYVCESEASLATSSLRLPADSRRAKYNHNPHALIDESPATPRTPPRPNGLKDSNTVPDTPDSTATATPTVTPLALRGRARTSLAPSAGAGSPHAARALHVLMALVVLGAVVLYALSKAKSMDSVGSLGSVSAVLDYGRMLTALTSTARFLFGGAWRRRAGQITRAEWAETIQPDLLAQMREVARQEALSAQVYEAHRERYAADKGLPPDYALASAGGKVLWTRPAQARKLAMYTYGILTALKNRYALPPAPRQPSVMLDPDVSPGMCWAFPANEKAEVVVRVARPVVINAVSVEHTPAMSAYYTNSAPKNLRISYVGNKDKSSDPDAFKHLAQIRFNPDDKHIQTFQLPQSDTVAKAVKFEITDNHGADVTCVYRLRVHGTAPQSE